MSFVYIVELIPLAGMTDESSQTSLAKQRNTEVCTIIDAHLNDRCYKRVPSIYPPPSAPTFRFLPPEGRIVIHVPLPQFFRAEVSEKKPFHLLCLISELVKGHRKIKFL